MNVLQIINKWIQHNQFPVVQYVHDHVCLPSSQLPATACVDTMSRGLTTLHRWILGKLTCAILRRSYVRLCALYVCFFKAVINTRYQKLPFGSGDHPDKPLFHQALNQVSIFVSIPSRITLVEFSIINTSYQKLPFGSKLINCYRLSYCSYTTKR